MIWIEPEEPEVIKIEECIDGLSKCISQEIKSRKISKEELGRRCGLTAHALYAIVNKNNKDVKLSTFLSIAKGFGIPASELFALIEDSVESNSGDKKG